MFISADVYCHFRGQLKLKRKVNQVELWKFIFVGFRRCQTKFERQCMENMPGNTVIFAVGVSIPEYE